MSQIQPLVGTALAEAVASRLESGHVLAHKHPEYCGVGLQHANGAFIVSEVFDGELFSESQYANACQRGERPEFAAFHSRAEFVAWLAQQSDESFSGKDLPQEWLRGNQRLSLTRLREFVA
jgi:hypothetical protein